MKEKRTSIYRETIVAAFFGLIVNLILGCLKLVVGLIASSFALIADSINSLGDSAASVIVLGSLWVAQKPSNKQHPYGHSRAEAIGALTVSLLIIVASLLIAWQALTRISIIHDIPPAWTLWIAALNVVVKELLFRYSLKIGQRFDSSAIVANAWDHRADALCSLSVLVGLGIVRYGGERLIWADEVAALIIVVIILISGFRLYSISAKELMDPQANIEIVTKIREIACCVEGVEEIEKLWVRKAGLEYFVDIHIQVDPLLSVEKGHDIAHDVKDRLLQNFTRIRDVLVHLEPFHKNNSKNSPNDKVTYPQ